MFKTSRHDKVTTHHIVRLSLGRKHLATEVGNHTDFWSALLVYTSNGKEVNITPVKLAEEHTFFYDWKDHGYSRKVEV
jgi:ATP sulfurylase